MECPLRLPEAEIVNATSRLIRRRERDAVDKQRTVGNHARGCESLGHHFAGCVDEPPTQWMRTLDYYCESTVARSSGKTRSEKQTMCRYFGLSSANGCKLWRRINSAMIPDQLYDYCLNCRGKMPVRWKSVLGGAFLICEGCGQTVDADWDDDPPAGEVTKADHLENEQ